MINSILVFVLLGVIGFFSMWALGELVQRITTYSRVSFSVKSVLEPTHVIKSVHRWRNNETWETCEWRVKVYCWEKDRTYRIYLVTDKWGNILNVTDAEYGYYKKLRGGQ